MQLFNHARRKYLVLIPLVLLLVSSFYNKYSAREIQNTMLRQKILEITDAVNVLAAAVEAIPDKVPETYENNIMASVEFLDNLYLVFSAAYKQTPEGLTRLSNRDFATNFDPLDYSEFNNAVLSNDSGNLTIGFTPEDGEYRDLFIYYRWMPLYSPSADRYLVVAGVSIYSIAIKVTEWVSIGQWANTILTFILNIWIVFMLVQLGYIYDMREGKGVDKWRDRRR